MNILEHAASEVSLSQVVQVIPSGGNLLDQVSILSTDVFHRGE